MNVLISLGEIVDKLTILEIKQTKINDPLKLIEIEKEINHLNNNNQIKDIKENFYYSILLYMGYGK